MTDANGERHVSARSIADAVQLYDCRLALEALSVMGACENANASQLQTLEKYVVEAEMLMQRQSSEFTSFQLLNLNYQFHRLIAESSGNKWLVSLLEQVFDKMLPLQTQITCHHLKLLNHRVMEIWIEHRQIYEAIAQGDIETATQAIKSHLTRSKARAFQALQHLQQ
jgi:DNA-binding GntR family transcriptional regulator